MADRDLVSARYFNQSNITLQLGAGVDPGLFGADEDGNAILARLTGAPDGSRIVMDRLPNIDAFLLRVHNTSVFQYPSEYALFNEERGMGLRMRMDSMYMRKELRGNGIGPRSVMLSLREAKALGFVSVSLEAAGSAGNRSTFYGYHVWPIMGFDASLPTEIKQRLPHGLAHAERLSDLMLIAEGVEWWYGNGAAMEVEFDLADGSISWQLYRRYAELKGIRL